MPGLWVWAPVPASHHGYSYGVWVEVPWWGNLEGGKVGRSLQHLSAFKEAAMVLPPIMHSKR